MEFLQSLWVQAAAVHPLAPYLAVSFLVGSLYWGWRKVHPESFHKLPPKVKTLPGAVVAALLALGAAADNASIQETLAQVLGTVFAGYSAGGWHQFLKHLVPAVFGANDREQQVKGKD